MRIRPSTRKCEQAGGVRKQEEAQAQSWGGKGRDHYVHIALWVWAGGLMLLGRVGGGRPSRRRPVSAWEFRRDL